MGHNTSPFLAYNFDEKPVLEAIGLTKQFVLGARGRRGTGQTRQVVHAVEDVSLRLYAGQVTALVGESGSGKSTVARLLAQLYRQTAGTVWLKGQQVKGARGPTFRRYVRDVQLIFQDPFSSLNPTRTIRHHLSRPLRLHHYARDRQELERQMGDLLGEVHLNPASQFIDKFPHELSGGQRQRIAMARALAARPSVLLADEPVSMLDVSVRLGILNLLDTLVKDRRLALLYITHDIASARYFATTTLVMYAGQLIEGGPSEAVTQKAAHPYTQLLIAASPDPERGRESISVKTDTSGEPPSLIAPPSGCRFHPRCPHASRMCVEAMPPTTSDANGHWVRCWLHVKSAGLPAAKSSFNSAGPGGAPSW